MKIQVVGNTGEVFMEAEVEDDHIYAYVEELHLHPQLVALDLRDVQVRVARTYNCPSDC
jgi:hypothetical protein